MTPLTNASFAPPLPSLKKWPKAISKLHITFQTLTISRGTWNKKTITLAWRGLRMTAPQAIKFSSLAPIGKHNTWWFIWHCRDTTARRRLHHILTGPQLMLQESLPKATSRTWAWFALLRIGAIGEGWATCENIGCIYEPTLQSSCYNWKDLIG